MKQKIDPKIDALITARRMQLVYRAKNEPFTRLLAIGGLGKDALIGETLVDIDLSGSDFSQLNIAETLFVDCVFDSATNFPDSLNLSQICFRRSSHETVALISSLDLNLGILLQSLINRIHSLGESYINVQNIIFEARSRYDLFGEFVYVDVVTLEGINLFFSNCLKGIASIHRDFTNMASFDKGWTETIIRGVTPVLAEMLVYLSQVLALIDRPCNISIVHPILTQIMNGNESPIKKMKHIIFKKEYEIRAPDKTSEHTE